RLFPEFLRVAAFRSSFHLISVSLILRNIDLHFFQPTSFEVRQHHHEIDALGDALRAQRAFVALRS
ncbi:MAG: hypothetical protein VB125_05030, partial [Burkholderia sp.]